MKYLVTGGAGFIGSHIVDRLVEEGHYVMVIDNFSTGRPENLLQHETNKNFNFIQADISRFETINHHFKNIDIVIHLAALADIVPSIVKPAEYYTANVNGTFCVVEAARLAGVKKLIYAASSSCYGIANTLPTNETAEIRPQYPYALTKFLGEQIILHWGKVYKLSVLSLRLFNVYGPRSRTSGAYGAVFGVFLAQKLAGSPFTVVGDGNQTRDFIYISDVVEAFSKAANSDLKDEVFNVGSGNPQSINKLVSLLGGEKIHIPKRPGEPDSTWADLNKIKSMLGWEPRVSFQDGVKIMLKNIEYWREAPVWTPESIQEATNDWFRCLTIEKKD